MATRTVNDQRLFVQQLTKTKEKPSVPFTEANTDIPTTIPVPQSSSAAAATNQSTNTLVTRTIVTPSTRIVVVRTTSTTENEEGEVLETTESERSKSVELPPVLTNGRTSVYLIRRPIPAVEPSKETRFYKTDDDEAGVTRTTTTTTTTTAGGNSAYVNGFQDNRTPSPLENTSISPDPRERRDEPSVRRTKSTRRRRFFSRSNSPELESVGNENNDDSSTRSPTTNNYESSTQLVSSATQDSLQNRTHRSRSRSKSRKRDSSRSVSKRRVRSTSHRISPTAQPTINQDETKNVKRKRSFFSFAQTKSTAVQANLLPREPVHVEQRAVQTTRPTITKKTLQKKSAKSRVKSAKAIVLVNPEDQTVAVIENPYLSGRTIKPVVKAQQSKSIKQTRFEEKMKYDVEPVEEYLETSRWYRCVGCLSRHMCLILTICLLFLFIGLAGVGVSAYFLATDSQSNTIPKIVGIIVGGILAILSLLILYCILACIGARDGYFTYNDENPHTGGQVYALIPPTHPNAHRYNVCDLPEVQEKKSLVSVMSYATSPPLARSSSSMARSASIHRQKTITTELASTTSAKNVTIEMPERLLTGRQMSPKTHERKIHKVVNNIEQVVDQTKKRYHGDIPTKVIVKIDDDHDKIKTKT